MPKSEKVSFNTMRSVFFFGLIIILSIGLLYLFRPFFYPIFWAAVIGIMFYPHYVWLNNYLKMPTLNAAITLAIVVLTIFVPLTLVGSLVVNESIKIYQEFSTNGGKLPSAQGVSTWLSQTPLEPYAQNLQNQWNSHAVSVTKAAGDWIITKLTDFTQNSARFLFQFFLMLYALFFFFRDGEKILQRVTHLSPLGNKYEQMLYDRFTSTTRATLKSTLIVGLVQGAIGGILFWLTGVPGALVLGVLMTALCVIPAFGSFLIWLPTGLAMLAFGNIWQGITILTVGFLVISTVDNFIRPPILGKDTQMHPLMVLFSTLGGIFLFGISGFIIGPVIASLYLAIISIYDHYYKNELESGNTL